ncbi:hypothetical protein BDA99DRAFT_574375 [Phascolomyces articulosus]|uniref:Rap-GAP domain-containing protein n=1 Tax=Phascolomyces articulosus TaxID=60185 RepID=A0AAD5JUB9_9FUNG|nr:hypothetical protein BDA99DRAFT_574375 [Phascolomyces articulosus]
MFLDWIAQLRLLQHDPQTNILGSLPLSIRRALISEITNYLQPGPGKHAPDPNIFASPAHVKWFMEVLGQGFSLPLEDMDITSNDVSIYAQWLFEPHLRPASVVNEGLEQEFYQIIFHQFSLLFQPRITQSPPVPPAFISSINSNNINNNTNNTNNNNTASGNNSSNINNINNNTSSNQQHQQQQLHPHPNHTQPQHSAHIGTSSGRPSSFYLNMLPVNPHANIVPVTLPSPTNAASPHVGSGAPSASSANNASALKETLSQLVHRHIELCKKTLTVLAMAGRTLEMSVETWTVLLKVVLGISDFLLKEPVTDQSVSGVVNMGDELCEHLLRVLFELWLRSRIREVEMWDILKECFMRWSHRPKAIQQWSSTTLSLTNRVLNLLYGSDEGTDVVILSANGINVKLDLPPDFVHYSWHRILYLAPHPLQLPSPNFTLMMLGIGYLVDLFNSVGERRTSPTNSIEPPDGNTILHIFGTYLFDACSTAPSANTESHRGCASAFASLCKVFCRPQRSTPFLRTYIERFYAALCVGLKSDACLPTILLHCTELFATDLVGVRMLAPEFISAIKMVLPKLQIDCRGFVSVDDLRLAAIKVVSTIMCLPNHFDKVELKPGWDWDMQCASDNASVMGEQEQIVTQLIRVLYADQHIDNNIERPFTGLKFYILELLLMSLRTETSSYNMRYLLHLINVYVIEDVPFCPGLVGTVVKLIEEKILTMQMPSDVTLVAFDVLIDFVDLYDYVKRDSKNVARELVLALSRYVDALINAGKLATYDCMIKWILVSQWIIDDQDCYKAVIATLSKGITIFDRETDTTNATEAQHPEKKKRRDTTFPPTKQLFQLPPRANKPTTTTTTNTAGTASANNNNSSPGPSSLASGSRSNSTVHKKEEVAVRMAAEYCMSQFVNQLGKFPSWNEQWFTNRKAMIISDLQQVKYRRWKQQQQQVSVAPDQHDTWESRDSIRYFLFDKRMILTVYDVESTFGPKETPSVVAIIRDTTGKYVWSLETRYKNPRKSPSFNGSSETTPTGTSPPVIEDNSGDSPLSDDSVPTIIGTTKKQSNDCVLQAPVAQAVNEDALPDIEHLFDKNSDNWKQWTSIQSIAECEQNAEAAAIEKSQTKPLDRYCALPTGENINTDSARGFRLLLSELGLLLPQNRTHITPLRITDTLITEIETLDMLNERDSISITTYYAQSGNTSWSELIESPSISEQFLQYLNCLGWPVEISDHQGFRGKLDPSVCDVAPYYADRTIEFLVNAPYLLKTPSPTDESTGWSSTKTISKIHQHVSSDDHVCVVWIEDLTNYTELARRIKMSSSNNSKAMVFIFINPLKNSGNGLYWIRILIPSIGNNATSVLASQRLNENALIFGPLVDGIIVNRHALGAMVRNTAISAHQACRVVTDTYTRPYVMRKQFIEEMAHRHRSKQQLSEFYSDVFIGKDN